MAPKLTAAKSYLAPRMNAFFSMSNTRRLRSRRFGFLAICAIAAGMMLSAPETRKNSTASAALIPIKLNTLDLTRHDLYLDDGSYAANSRRIIEVKPGQSLGPILQENDLSGQMAYRVTQAFSKSFDPRDVRAGHKFSLHYSDGNFSGLTYKPRLEKTVFVTRQGEDFTSKIIEAEFKMDVVTIKSSIQNSLYLDANRLGATDKVIQQFASIYEYSVDFQRDIRPGDAFEMFFEVARDHKGEIIKSGDLIYTSFSPRGKTSEYYLYADSRGRENYYDAKGTTAKRKLRATPVNGARLSSGFGRRKHPVLGYVKNHKGVDFAAPRGTPILAAGTGTIERANRYGSFGNYVRIRHSDGYKTAYAHLKGFAPGIKSGKHVRQDQVIGYVGTTGRSTGPHLHYEVHRHGKAINPRTLAQLSGKKISKAEKPNFDRRRADTDKRRKAAETITTRPAETTLSAEINP